MMVSTVRHCAVFLAALTAFAVTAPVSAVVIASNTAGTATYPGGYVGQSFTVEGSGSFQDITFSFFDGYTNAQKALGTLYIFSTAYTGSVSGLKTASNLVGKATAANNLYSFDPSVMLSGGDKYYAYADDYFTVRAQQNTYAAGNFYFAELGNPKFASQPNVDADFQVTGTAVVPEPAAWAMMLAGFGAIGFSLRHRKAVAGKVLAAE